LKDIQKRIRGESDIRNSLPVPVPII